MNSALQEEGRFLLPLWKITLADNRAGFNWIRLVFLGMESKIIPVRQAISEMKWGLISGFKCNLVDFVS